MSWTILKPNGFRILVRLHPRRTQYGLLEIPDEFRKMPETAEVIAVSSRLSDEIKTGPIAEAVQRWAKSGSARDRKAIDEVMHRFELGDDPRFYAEHPDCVVITGKYNGAAVESPEWDPHAEDGMYRVLECDLKKRGKKLPARVMGHDYAPHIVETYGLLDPEGMAMRDILEATSSDVPKRRLAS